MSLNKIGLGGGCHWCTEAIFQSLKGVYKVEQGWIASKDENTEFSEAIIVHFDPNVIDLFTLINIHLLTHSSTVNHSMRHKYRSAVYYYSKHQKIEIDKIISKLQIEFDNQIVTKSYAFNSFQSSPENLQNYYLKNPNKPFCKRYIDPKLNLILKKFGKDFFQKN